MDSIAIVGMACRFPGAPSLAAYWRLLSEGRSAEGLVPAERWDADAFYSPDPKQPGKVKSRSGCFIEDIDRFDAGFFGISPREAVQMDPQQRILLELASEAFEDAGIASASLGGSDTAVYVGVMSNDYLRYQTADHYHRIDVHTGGGAGFCMLANRLSYQFNLNGPSMAIDSACSSSLVAVFAGCQALWSGQTDLVLAGGVNLMLDPAFNVFYSKSGLLAPDGRCKTFSAEANGIGRGEGAGLVVLKRERDALRDGDAAYASIRGGAVNHGGRSNGVTAPNRWAQERLLRAAWRHARVRSDELQYVELHGTGTYIGDTIEANALGAAMKADGRTQRCLVGSAKTNIAHLEGAAGVAGLIKLVLCIQHRMLAPSLWFDVPNPGIDFEALPLDINTALRPWPTGSDPAGPLVAGISAFGLGGTNAHLVVSSPSSDSRVDERTASHGHLLVISARSEAALRDQAVRFLELLSGDVDPDAVCMTAMRRRNLYEHRLHVVASDRRGLQVAIGEYLGGALPPAVIAGRLGSPAKAVRVAIPEAKRLAPVRVAKWLLQAPHGRHAWKACEEASSSIGGSRLPGLAELADGAPPEGEEKHALCCFAAQFSVLRQLIATLAEPVILVPEGAAQLAACCASGAVSLPNALEWVRRGLRPPCPPIEPYGVRCECGEFVNPALDSIDWKPNRKSWLRRLSSADQGTVIVVANVDGTTLSVEAQHCVDGHDNDFGHLFARLNLLCRLRLAELADSRFVRLPTYPWQRESYWLPRPTDQGVYSKRDMPAEGPAAPPGAGSFRSRLLAEAEPVREGQLLAYLRERVGTALRVPPEQLDSAQPLSTMGMDSLTAVEVKNHLEADLKVNVPAVKFLDGSSVSDFVEYLQAELAADSELAAAPSLDATGELPSDELERAQQQMSSAVSDPHEAHTPLRARLTRPGAELVMSSAQERLWQLNQIAPGDPVYNFQSAVVLKGALNPEALSEAVARVVARHETLRIRFGSMQGRPRLEVISELLAPVEFFDWSARAPESQESSLQAAATAVAQTRFILSEPPLFRLQCFKLGVEKHAVILTMHHIVSDLLSLDLFLEEVGRNYGAILRGGESPLPQLEWTYQEHARAEQGRRAELKGGPAGRFWHEHLAGTPDLVWRSDYPRPRMPTKKAATVHFRLDAETVAAVTRLARTERATPFMLLTGAYYVLQRAATGSDDQIVCVPTAGRDRATQQALIGMFSSPLPVRTTIAADLTLCEVIARVRQTMLAVAEHAALPFADIVELGQAANGGRLPELRSMLSFVGRMRVPDFPGLQIERLPTNRGVSDFDLFLTVYEDGGCWQGAFEYSTDLFGEQTARGWAEAYSAMVRGMAADPGKTVAELAELVPLPSVLQIAVAATFTADDLEEVATFWGQEIRWPVRTLFAPYNQVFHALLDPASELRRDGNVMNVLLVRPEDWVRYCDDPAERRAMLAKAADEFVDASRSARLGVPLAIYLCPASPGLADADAVTAAEDRIENALSGTRGVTVLRAQAALQRYGLPEVHDGRADQIGHVPYVRHWFVALGTELVRRAHSIRRPPSKVIALDCDNTLWRGVCAEDGANAVRVDGPFRELQELLVRQAADGMLLCLVSKNEPEDVFRVFESNEGMVLTRDHVVAHRINWEPKSANLRALAAELRLGLDSFVFIDDNPVECAEVRTTCPEVLTLCLPENAEGVPDYFASVWAFDRVQVSAEDRNRAATMQHDRQRAELRRQEASFADFISKLELQVETEAARDGNIARLAQLSQRTNQFNNSGVRYDETELRHALAAGLQALTVSVRDRFGDYGVVGVMTYRVVEATLRVDAFLLSCRVLGRGVEYRMLAELGRRARELDLREVRFAVQHLPRNEPFRTFLATLDGAYADDRGSFVVSATSAAKARFEPERQGLERESPSGPVVAGTTSEVYLVRQAALAVLPEWLRTAEDVLARLDAGNRRVRGGGGGAPPKGEVEEAIAEIWRDVLRINEVARDDNFFEVGGNSLLLVQVNGRLIERLATSIEITTLFQFPTIASLAGRIARSDDGIAARTRIRVRGEQARRQLQQRMQQLGGTRRARSNHLVPASAPRPARPVDP